MTAAEITRQMAVYPELAVEEPPPADMPPVPLIVLDSLADGSETIYSMRNCGDMAAYGVALVGESHQLTALRSLLGDGLVEVEDEHVVIDGRLFVRPLAERARTADEDLSRYWFRMTLAGEETWRQVSDVLDAYRDAHPLELADESQ